MITPPAKKNELLEMMEKVPGAKYLLPDPYDVSSYVAPLGAAKVLPFVTKKVGATVEDILHSLSKISGRRGQESAFRQAAKRGAKEPEEIVPILDEIAGKQRNLEGSRDFLNIVKTFSSPNPEVLENYKKYKTLFDRGELSVAELISLLSKK